MRLMGRAESYRRSLPGWRSSIRWTTSIGASTMLRADLRDGLHSRRNLSHGIRPSLSRGSAEPSRCCRRLLDRPHARAPVSNHPATTRSDPDRQFKQFVDATVHVTEAQVVPDPKDYPGALAEMLYAGSLVFSPLPRITDLTDWSQWWTFLRGANWRHPYGPGSNIKDLDDHPVVHVSFSDAAAYAHRAGKDLPTEAEWEF